MAKFPNDLYFIGADEPTGVLAWGKSPEQTEKDLAAGVARLGGFRAPNYTQAYLLAANTLILTARERGLLDQHGLPIFYLQRHAAELIIKAPLRLGIEIQEYRKKLNVPRPAFPSNRQAWRAERWHGLRELLRDLEVMAAALQVGTVPAAVRSAVQTILAVEQDPTWSRYSYRHETENGVDKLVPHMASEVVLPLGAIQNQLQAANDALGIIWPFGTGLMISNLGELWEGLARAAGDLPDS